MSNRCLYQTIVVCIFIFLFVDSSALSSEQNEERKIKLKENVSADNAVVDISKLRPYKKREFVPEDANLKNPAQAQALYEKLLTRPVVSASELEKLVLDRSELEAAMSEAETVLNIRMTCQTDDENRVSAYKEFVKNVKPVAKSLAFKLDKRYLELQNQYHLDSWRYAVYNRNKQINVELFRQENVPLQTEEDLLEQEYQTLNGAMTVQFRGQEYTLQQMMKFQFDPNRSLREAAWRAAAKRRLEDKDKLEALFDKMYSLRNRIAANAGCANYRDYIWKRYQRFDYAPDDCKRFHDAVEKVIVPILKQMASRRCSELGTDNLRPWDTDVDTQSRPPLRPFETTDQLTIKMQDVFSRIEPDFGTSFSIMIRKGLLDLASRKGKAPGGYQSTLDEARLPFIFMNAVGLQRDVETILHEGGHAIHAMAAADEPIIDYRSAPTEFCEVASMSMELIGARHLDVFYNKQELRRVQKQQFEEILKLLAHIAVIDSFQHSIYEEPCKNRDERKAKWITTCKRFGDRGCDWSGLEDEYAYYWHRQLHIFQFPFYYIEYGIAQLGSLQLWAASQGDCSSAMTHYRHALSLGGSRPLPELFAAAGLKFNFSEKTLKQLAESIQKELENLE
jgi:oligoendopeptidase F